MRYVYFERVNNKRPLATIGIWWKKVLYTRNAGKLIVIIDDLV